LQPFHSLIFSITQHVISDTQPAPAETQFLSAGVLASVNMLKAHFPKASFPAGGCKNLSDWTSAEVLCKWEQLHFRKSKTES